MKLLITPLTNWVNCVDSWMVCNIWRPISWRRMAMVIFTWSIYMASFDVVFFLYICSALCLLWYHIIPNRAMPRFTYVYFSPLCAFILYTFSLIILFVSLPTITIWTWTTPWIKQKYVNRFIVNHPVQICVNTINMQNNLLMILSAHYQPAISQLFTRLLRNITCFVFLLTDQTHLFHWTQTWRSISSNTLRAISGC